MIYNVGHINESGKIVLDEAHSAMDAGYIKELEKLGANDIAKDFEKRDAENAKAEATKSKVLAALHKARANKYHARATEELHDRGFDESTE